MRRLNGEEISYGRRWILFLSIIFFLAMIFDIFLGKMGGVFLVIFFTGTFYISIWIVIRCMSDRHD